MKIEKVLCGNKSRTGIILSGLALASFLAGCAGPTATVTSPTASTTSTSATASTKSTATVPTVNSTFQKEFIGWAEACQAYALGAYGATTAIAGNKIKASAFPKIKEILATTGPLCHTFPTNPQQIDIAITEATAALAEQMQANQITSTPSAAASSYQFKAGTYPTLSHLLKTSQQLCQVSPTHYLPVQGVTK